MNVDTPRSFCYSKGLAFCAKGSTRDSPTPGWPNSDKKSKDDMTISMAYARKRVSFRRWIRLHVALSRCRKPLCKPAAALALMSLGLLLLVSCGSSASAISIQIIPASVSGIDEGQSILLTATTGGDTTNSGVTWSIPTTNTTCAGSGCGSLTNSSKISTTYVAPTNLSTSLTVTVEATSVADSSVTKTISITVVLPPTFTLTGLTECSVNVYCLTNGSNGEPYSQTITASGGVAPLTFTVQPNTLPAGLSLSTVGTIAGRPSGPIPAQPNPVVFTVTVTDTPLAPATPATATQQFSISITPAPPLSMPPNQTLPAAFINAKYGAAIASSGGVPPLTWTLVSGSLPPGLNLGPNSGQIMGIPTSAAQTQTPYAFTVQVQDSSLPVPGQIQQATISIQIQQPPALAVSTTSLPNAFTAAGYNAPLQATGGIPPYTWSIISGQLPAGLTFGSNGVISGTPIEVTNFPAQFTVQVQDSELNPATGLPQPASATQSLQMTVNQGTTSNNSLFSGPYVFFFNGFDAQGVVAIAGSFSSGGAGTITGGVEDSNRVSGLVTSATLTGSYSLGTDGRGTLQLISTNPQTGVQLTSDYQLAMESDGSIRFFENDTTGTRGSGIIKPTQGATFTGASFNGNYAFELVGQDISSRRTVLGGVINADGNSTLSEGAGDFNEGGVFSPSINLSGIFSGGSSNRSLANLTFQLPSKSQTTLDYAFYFVSSSDLFFVSIDPIDATHPLLSGEFIQQQPSVRFSNATLAGVSVVSGTGLDGSNSSVLAGLLTGTINPNGSTSATFTYDQNDGGSIASLSFPCLGCAIPNFSVATNGRATFSNLASPSGQPRLAVAYLTGPGTGFILGSDSTATAGLLEAQQPPIPPAVSFALSNVQGSYVLGTPSAAENQVPDLAGQVVASGGGSVTGIVDEVDPASINLDQSLVSNYSVAANGRGTMTANNLVGFPVNLVFYVVSPGSIRLISVDPGNTNPQAFFFDH